MLPEIYRIIFAYFFIGAIAVAFINRKENTMAAKVDRWIKYGTYLLIVNLVVLTIYYQVFFLAGILIIILGFIEIILVNKHRFSEKLVVPLLIYCILAYFFLGFCRAPFPILLLIYTLVFTFDGFSQISGQLFGRHKITPKISPNKTREGFLGGVIITTFTSVIFHYTLNDFVHMTLPGAIIAGIIVSGLAFAGDLLASYYKRLNKVKDYSNFIPGHGGVLDRFDSFIFVAASAQVVDYFTR